MEKNRISLLQGDTVFFVFFILGLTSQEFKNNICLFSSSTELSFNVNCFLYSVVCLFFFVCVGGAGSFFKWKINNGKLKDIAYVIARACSWQSLTNLFRDCFILRNDLKTEKRSSFPNLMLKQGWYDSTDEKALSITLNLFQGLIRMNKIKTHIIARACSWQSLTNLFRDCFILRNDMKTEKRSSFPNLMLKQGWHCNNDEKALSITLNLFQGLIKKNKIKTYVIARACSW
ncbi:hypothetical protein KRX57_07420 [Weeksellaceae bacterium TAE3-ERU29]|nr:hypothetical protein [Weeksellaceae bacterium TAE3-ERU29]